MSSQIVESEFWNYSVQTWTPKNSQLCIHVQDKHMADCNLILLILFLANKGQSIENTAVVFQKASDCQRQVLRPLRTARRGLKVSDLYDDIKSLELKAEQKAQQELLSSLKVRQCPQQVSQLAEMMLADYFSFLSVIAPAVEAKQFIKKILD